MHSNQRGGIVSFIIVAVALAGLLGGALYFSKQQGREARDATPAPQISEREDSKENETKNEQPSDDTSRNDTAQKPNTSGTQNQQPQGQNQTQQAPATQAPTGGADRVANTGPSQDLPSTGPTETAAVVVGLGTLTFASYMLITSRRGLRHSALRK